MKTTFLENGYQLEYKKELKLFKGFLKLAENAIKHKERIDKMEEDTKMGILSIVVEYTDINTSVGELTIAIWDYYSERPTLTLTYSS